MTPRLLLVGLGRFGTNHLRVLKQLSNERLCDLVGVVEIRKQALDPGVVADLQVTTSLDELLPECDAVDIVTPTDTHYEIVKRCLNAGKDVFVEKPLTSSSTEASELVALGKEHRRILGVGHILRYDSTVATIKSMVQREEIGSVQFLDARYMGTQGQRTDSGVLFNLAIHLVDLYSFLLDQVPLEIFAFCHKFSAESKYEDHAILNLTYPSHATGHITVTWLSSEKIRDLIVVGGRSTLAADFARNRITLSSEMNRSPGTQMATAGAEPLVSELRNFVECVCQRRKPISDGESAVTAIRILERAQESSRLGRPVPFD
jgi:predicted dehydrogenase